MMRRVVPLVACALASSACDVVFDLDHLDPPADAAPCTAPIGHDEDQDGLDDRCDPCPFAPANDGDADGDGIANACDPEPDVADDVVLFTGFDPASRSELTVGDGSYTADAFHATSGGFQAVIWNGDPEGVWVIAGLDVEAIGVSTYREVGFVFDATVAAQSNELNGTYCVLGRYADVEDYLEVFARDRPAGDTPINHSTSDLALADLDGTMRAHYTRTGSPTASCTFETVELQPTVSGTRAVPALPGGLALFADDADVSFRFLFVVRPH